MSETLANAAAETIKTNPTSLFLVLGIAIVLIAMLIAGGLYLFMKSNKSIQIGNFRIDASQKESVKEPENEKEKELADARKSVEDYTRSVIAKQFDQVNPFLKSLRPIFNRLVHSILNEAMVESLGIEREIRIPRQNEAIDGMQGSYYKVETVKTYMNTPQTRVFTNLVESTVDSLIHALELEIHNMLVNNNIGKTKDQVRAYIHSKSETLVGIIRNCLCDSYNALSNKNLFDTNRFWEETGITYPIDWIEDKLYKLFVLCLQSRYSDFED